MVISGGMARPVAGYFRVEHRRWGSLGAATGPFLLARGLWTAPGSVVALLRDRDAAAARLFDMAAQIAAATDSLLAVLCAPALLGTAGMENWVTERAAPHRVRFRVEAAPPEPDALRERLVQLDCRVIALDAGLLERGDGGLGEFVERFSCDMLVVP